MNSKTSRPWNPALNNCLRTTWDHPLGPQVYTIVVSSCDPRLTLAMISKHKCLPEITSSMHRRRSTHLGICGNHRSHRHPVFICPYLGSYSLPEWAYRERPHGVLECTRSRYERLFCCPSNVQFQSSPGVPNCQPAELLSYCQPFVQHP